jgi:surface protein
LAFLVGCGGSSSVSGSSDDLSAQFVDSPVANLDYKTDILNGVTDSNGYFEYGENDEKVEFFVGNIKIGEFNLSKLNSDKKILPSELFGLDRNNTTDDRLVKVIVFLQSLDSDNNPNNGITIDDNVKDTITNLLENNTTIKISLLDNNYTVMENIIKTVGKTMILENVARENYKNYLKTLGYTSFDFMPFTTVWSVSGDDKNITIPINPNYAGEYNYTVDWGDGNISTDVNDSITHTYANDGNYTVKITGEFPAIYLNNDGKSILFESDNVGNADKLLEIRKWGDIEWKSFESAFAGDNNLLIIATDIPNLKNVKNMRYAFADCKKFNSNINNWDVSNVTDMSWMFYDATSFNQPLNNWDVSNVIYMYWMFYNAASFNQPLNNWDVSNITNMKMTFYNAFSFDQNISMWDVSNVTDYSFFATNCPINGTDKMPKFSIGSGT